MGVFAQVKHRILDGSDVELTASDIAEIEKMRGCHRPLPSVWART